MADSPFDPTTLATSREVKRWKQSKRGEFCCTSDSFRIDINSGALNNWNRLAAVVFADAFGQSGNYDCEDQDLIAEAFMTHLRTLRKKYRERDRTAEEVGDSQKKGRRDQRKEKVGVKSIFVYRSSACSAMRLVHSSFNAGGVQPSRTQSFHHMCPCLRSSGLTE